jgi:hypothetical protein
MKTQGITGKSTEQKVQACLKLIGLESEKPKPDKGIDLIVWDSANHEKKPFIKIQIKGRGSIQQNGRHRWFQIRTTKKQRDDTEEAGLPVSETWQKKVDLCDFFVLVSEKHEEYWVFPVSIIYEIIEHTKDKYKNREDNISGKQVEINLDLDYQGRLLTDIYASYKNNFALIRERLKN